MSDFWKEITTIFTALFMVAIVALLVSRNANTQGITQAGLGGMTNLLSVAVSPVAGNSSYSTGGYYG